MNELTYINIIHSCKFSRKPPGLNFCCIFIPLDFIDSKHKLVYSINQINFMSSSTLTL